MSTELAATLSNLTTDDPRRFVRAGLTRAHHLGVPRPKALAMIRSAGTPAVSQLLDNPHAVKQIASDLATYRTASRSPSGAAGRRRVARLILARILGGDYSWSERALHTIIGLRLIDSGWPSVQVSAATLAVEAGMSERSTHAALHRLVEKRALRIVRQTGGHANVWKLEPLHHDSERAGMEHLRGAIESLADPDDTSDPVVAAVRGVASPEWGYVGGRTWRHWVGTVAKTAGHPMPCSSRVHRQTMRELDRPVDLAAAVEARVVAEQARAERAAARVAEVESARETWRASRAWVEQVEASAGPAYKATTAQDRHAWLGVARAGVQAVPQAERAGLGRYLANHLRKARWGTTTAAKASQAVVR